MSTTVFILGAGASQEAGAPLMGNFLDVAHVLWKTERTHSPEAFKNLFEAIGHLQQVHSKAELNIDNIESVFASFEMAKTLGGFGSVGEVAIDGIIASMRTVIVQTIEESLRFPIRPGDHGGSVLPPVPYESLVLLLLKLMKEISPPQSVSVITFNYDLAVDYALFYAGVPSLYGLEKDGRGVPLLKLHGSMNWYRCQDCRSVTPVSMENFFSKHHWNLFGIENKQDASLVMSSNIPGSLRCGHSPAQTEIAIVPPTWNKTDYHRQIATVWSRAARELSGAENIFCIGYSLPETDYFFRSLYQLGTVGKAPLKRFWVFDPDKSDAVENRFRSLLGPGARAKFEMRRKTFEESLTDIAAAFRR